MKEIKTTIGDLRSCSKEEIKKMADETDHPEFVKRMLEEIQSQPATPGDKKGHIQWSWSYM